MICPVTPGQRSEEIVCPVTPRCKSESDSWPSDSDARKKEQMETKVKVIYPYPQ